MIRNFVDEQTDVIVARTICVLIEKLYSELVRRNSQPRPRLTYLCNCQYRPIDISQHLLPSLWSQSGIFLQSLQDLILDVCHVKEFCDLLQKPLFRLSTPTLGIGRSIRSGSAQVLYSAT
jgi:hypothetical protein